MAELIKKKKREIIFAAMCTAVYYIMPFIMFYFADGDGTDAIMWMFIIGIPLMLFAVSLLYGAIARKTIAASCCAAVLFIPWIFDPMIGGDSLSDKARALQIFIPVCFSITFIGTWVGRLTGKAIDFCRSSIRKQKAGGMKNSKWLR